MVVAFSLWVVRLIRGLIQSRAVTSVLRPLRAAETRSKLAGQAQRILPTLSKLAPMAKLGRMQKLELPVLQERQVPPLIALVLCSSSGFGKNNSLISSHSITLL